MSYDVRRTAAFDAWLSSLRDVRAVRLVVSRLDRLQAQGHWGDCDSVGGGVIEMRLFYGPGLRLYVTERSGRLVVVLGGGDKGSQNRDIAAAVRAAEDIR